MSVWRVESLWGSYSALWRLDRMDDKMEAGSLSWLARHTSGRLAGQAMCGLSR